MVSVGIDLGTSNSTAAISFLKNKSFITEVIPLSKSGKQDIIKSSIAFDSSDMAYIGINKINEKYNNPEILDGFKTHIGTPFLYSVNGKFHSPVELSAIILGEIKSRVEKYTGAKLSGAVITVPAYFSEIQRNSVRESAQIAGLKLKQLVAEPTAAAIAYGYKHVIPNDGKILVYDMGAGTTDVSVIEFKNGNFNVLSTAGDLSIGGNAMDEIIINYMERFLAGAGLKLSSKIFDSYFIEKLKIKLAGGSDINIKLNKYIKSPAELRFIMTYSQFKNDVIKIIKKTEGFIGEAIYRSGVSLKEINTFILTGGPSKINFLRNELEEYTGIKPAGGINPVEIVATGASLIAAGVYRAGINSSGKIHGFSDVVPLTLGTVQLNDVMVPLIKAGSQIPCNAVRPFTTVRDYQSSMEIKIVQGDRPMGSDNIMLGEILLDGIKSAPRGKAHVNLEFMIDKNGILSVHAIDTESGSISEIVINSDTMHNEEKITELKKSVKFYIKSDSIRKEMAERMNIAENFLYYLKQLANSSLNGGESFYDLNADIKKLAMAIKDNKIMELSGLIKVFQNKYGNILESN